MYSIFRENKLKKTHIKELVRIYTNSHIEYWSGQEIKYEQYYVDNLKVWFIVKFVNDTKSEFHILEKITNPLWCDDFRNWDGACDVLIRQNNFLNKVCKENNINFNKLFNKHLIAKYENNIYHYSRLKSDYDEIKQLNKGA